MWCTVCRKDILEKVIAIVRANNITAAWKSQRHFKFKSESGRVVSCHRYNYFLLSVTTFLLPCSPRRWSLMAVTRGRCDWKAEMAVERSYIKERWQLEIGEEPTFLRWLTSWSPKKHLAQNTRVWEYLGGVEAHFKEAWKIVWCGISTKLIICCGRWL